MINQLSGLCYLLYLLPLEIKGLLPQNPLTIDYFMLIDDSNYEGYNMQ